MNPTTHIVCGGLPVPADAGEAVVPLDRRPGGNLYLDEDQLLGPLMAPPTAALRDLLDIAAYVYAADQSVARGANRTSDGDHGWRRAFHFHIPLRCPDLWTGHANDLADLLGFLSDDDYWFDFAPSTDSSAQQRIQYPHSQFVTFDEVALFSGGLDSLAGAVRLVAAGKQPLLVTHRSIDKLAGRQDRLLAGLRERAGDRRPVHLTVKVNKEAELTRENSQRSRSFLYAALGGLIAATAGKGRLLVFENGPLSLNLPPSGAVVGTRATRTTHPRALAGFTRLLSVAAGRPLAVENPFDSHTKTDVVAALIEAGGRDLIRWSTSCVHTHEMSAAFPHCGRCSQCLDRRFAVLAAGEETADPAEGYRVELLTGERSAESAGLLAAYIEQATPATVVECWACDEAHSTTVGSGAHVAGFDRGQRSGHVAQWHRLNASITKAASASGIRLRRLCLTHSACQVGSVAYWSWRLPRYVCSSRSSKCWHQSYFSSRAFRTTRAARSMTGSRSCGKPSLPSSNPANRLASSSDCVAWR